MSKDPIADWDDDDDDILGNPTDEEEEDPLFGKFENNKALGLLLSPKKKKLELNKVPNPLLSPTKKRNSSVLGDSDKLRNQKVKKRTNTVDILQQLQSRMKNPLDKELGFSVNKTSINSFYLKDFNKILTEKKRDSEINKLLEEEENIAKNNEFVEKEINQWVVDHVNKDFLEINTDGVKVHSRWMKNLKKDMKKIIEDNNNVYDKVVLEKGISKFSKYFPFKCFTKKGIVDLKTSMLYDNNSFDILIKTASVQYVENFIGSKCKINDDPKYKNLTTVLDCLGFDETLIESNAPIEKKFDRKDPLPIDGCGLQAFKFIQLLKIDSFNLVENMKSILSSLILMSLDYNVGKDVRTYLYKNKMMNVIDIILDTVYEYKENISLINKILKDYFKESQPELWFIFVERIFTLFRIDNFFKGQLVMHFLEENRVNDNVEWNFDNDNDVDDVNNIDNNSEIFERFCTYIESLSYAQLQEADNTTYPAIIYMKVELMKNMIISNELVIKKWMKEDYKKYESFKRSILRLKNNYFKKCENSLDSNIPKSKRILDFIYHEISAMDVEDFFAEDSSAS